MNNLTPTQIQNAKNVSCEKCNNQIFKQVFVIKHISALLTQSGKDMMAPVPIFVCFKCDHVNKIFSEELKINEETQQQELLQTT